MLNGLILFLKPDWKKILVSVALLLLSFLLYFPAIIIGMLVCLVLSLLFGVFSCPCLHAPEEGPSLSCFILVAIIWYLIVCSGFHCYDVLKNKKRSLSLTILSLIILGIGIAATSYSLYVLIDDALHPPEPKPYIPSTSKKATSTQLEESTSTPPEENIPRFDTSDWKTYRNEEYGFEIKYPPNVFKIDETQHPKSGRKYIAFSSGRYLGLLVTKEEDKIHGVPIKSIHSLEELKKALGKGKNLDFGMVVTSNIKFDKTVVGNQYQALQVDWETTKVEGRDFYILLTNGTPKVIIISVEWRLPEDRAIVEKMLSTVKFLYK